jgi:hypothetical protein
MACIKRHWEIPERIWVAGGFRLAGIPPELQPDGLSLLHNANHVDIDV